MRIFTFRYEKQAFKNAMHSMDDAIKTGTRHIRKHEMVCSSLKTLLNFASQKGKFETFEGILLYKPDSLYELAQALKKDQGQLLKEARSLEAMGLVRLTAIKNGGRERLKPEALYDKIVFEVEPKQAKKIA